MLRRAFLANSFRAGTALLGTSAWAGGSIDTSREAAIREWMAKQHIPGVATCLLDRDGVMWEEALGSATLPDRPMSLDAIQNLGSISKTFVTLALMQLEERRELSLEADVSEYLGFTLRNPGYPDVPITVLHLITHVSSLRDGVAYARAYGCGDSRIDLAAWIEGYFRPGGGNYHAKENFETWAPGEQWTYCNLTYGVAALIVERVSGMSFPDYCSQHIFQPLRMHSTSWHLSGIDTGKHTTPYSWVEHGQVRGPSYGGVAQGIITNDNASSTSSMSDGFHANCLYGHPNYPDGFLRSSVRQVSRYLRALLREGELDGARILEGDNVRRMLTVQRVAGKRSQGLTWYAEDRVDGNLAWGHTGSDPGINNDVRLLPALGLGAMVLTNTNGVQPWTMSVQLLRSAVDA